jgi:hypothetical protein
MNKRGQVAMLMLVIVTIVLVIVALVTFTGTDRKFGEDSVLISGAFVGVDQGYNYDIETAKLMVKETINSGEANLDGELYSVSQTYSAYGMEKSGTFFRVLAQTPDTLKRIDGGNYLFTLGKSNEPGQPITEQDKQIIIEQTSGNNLVRRYFKICLIFDSKGEYLSEAPNQDLYTKNCK